MDSHGKLLKFWVQWGKTGHVTRSRRGDLITWTLCGTHDSEGLSDRM